MVNSFLSRLGAAQSREAKIEMAESFREELQMLHVQKIAEQLSSFSKLYPGTYGLVADQLAAALQLSGPAALVEAELTYSGPFIPLTFDELRDSALISDVAHWSRGSDDPLREALAPALCAWAERRIELSEIEAGYLALEKSWDSIAAAPSRIAVVPRYYTVPAGADLRDIALAVLGDPDLWPNLVRQYSLEPPYLSDTPQYQKLSPGTRLLLPPDPLGAETEGLGETFALEVSAGSHGFGQVWDLIAQEGIGLASEAGLDAFATDLALRLATPHGSLEGEDQYGVAPVAGLPYSQTGLLQEIVAADALREDERVSTVRVVTAKTPLNQTGVLLGNVFVTPRPELLSG